MSRSVSAPQRQNRQESALADISSFDCYCWKQQESKFSAMYLKSHRIACAGFQRLGCTDARKSDHLASREVAGFCVHHTSLTGSLVTEREAGRNIGATRAAESTRGLVLTGNALALDPGDSEKIGFQINHVSRNVGNFRTANETEGVAAFFGMLKLYGHLGV